MGLGKIVGLGDFGITYSSSTPNYTFYNQTVGNSVTISKDTLIDEDFWKRVMTIGQIKFVLYGGKGGNGGSTSSGRGGNGGNGLVVYKTYNVSSNDSFVLELSGSKYYGNRGGAGGKAPVPTSVWGNEDENAGKAGIGGGGGGGCSGESYSYETYDGQKNVLHLQVGGNGGDGGHGCSVYVRKGSITEILATACGGGGGGGASGPPASTGYIDGEGGFAGEGGRIVNGVPTPGAGGRNTRDDHIADGEDAFPPSYDYTSTSLQPRIEVFAPQW